MNANLSLIPSAASSFLKASGVVGAASILAACGGSSSSTAASTSGAASGAAAPAADAITDYVSFETANRELETWNFLYSQSASDMNVTTNCWDGLLSFDCYGKAVPAIASSWEHNEDSTVWTFHLRDNVDWCDVNGEVKSHLISKDFLVGFEWVLNALKNEAFNTSMPSETVVGAAEYYDLTKDKGDAAADMTYEDMLAAGVGIEAPDDYTLVFTCKTPAPTSTPSLLTTASTPPLRTSSMSWASMASAPAITPPCGTMVRTSSRSTSSRTPRATSPTPTTTLQTTAPVSSIIPSP